MKARVTVRQGPAGLPEDQVNAILSHLRDESTPKMRQTDGNRGVMILSDPEGGKMIAITLWENEAAMRASEEQAERVRDRASEATADAGPNTYESIERYDMAILDLDSAIVEGR